MVATQEQMGHDKGMTTFQEARDTVERSLGATLAEGYEDSEDFNVLLAEPSTDDQVNLVTKSTGKLHREVYFDVEDRLRQMTPVQATPASKEEDPSS